MLIEFIGGPADGLFYEYRPVKGTGLITFTFCRQPYVYLLIAKGERIAKAYIQPSGAKDVLTVK